MNLSKRLVRRMIIPRVEPFSMSFKSKINSNGISDNNKFKGRIFLADEFTFHELYNSEKEKEYNLRYTELSRLQQQKLAPILGLRGRNVRRQELPVMGHLLGGYMPYQFTILVVDDNTSPELQFSLDHAPPPTQDDWGECDRTHWDCFHRNTKLDRPKDILVDGAFGSIKLHWMMLANSKVVRVQLKWIPKEKHVTDDILICGEVTVSCPTFQSCKSFLLKIPPNKALKASVGQPIPLLKSVVSISNNDSGFIVSANLVADDVNDADSAATVQGSAKNLEYLKEGTSECVFGFNSPGFNVLPSTDEESIRDNAQYSRYSRLRYFSRSTKHIEGVGADLEVSVYVDITSSI